MKVSVMLSSRSARSRYANTLDPPPPGLQPIASKPRPANTRPCLIVDCGLPRWTKWTDKTYHLLGTQQMSMEVRKRLWYCSDCLNSSGGWPQVKVWQYNKQVSFFTYYGWTLREVELYAQLHSLRKKPTIHQVTTMLATFKNVLFPGHNHLLTTRLMTCWCSGDNQSRVISTGG